jgi:hypothetical protein
MEIRKDRQGRDLKVELSSGVTVEPISIMQKLYQPNIFKDLANNLTAAAIIM